MNPQTHRVTMPDGQDIVLDWYEPRAAPARCAVFVHGLASERRGEKALYFAEQFTACGWGYLCIDLRGHGEAGGTLTELTLTRCLADLDAGLGWMPAGGRPPVLIGSSMGGAIAAWYTVTHSRPVGPLVLLAPSVRFPGHFVTSLPAEELAAWQRHGTRRLQSDWAEIHLGYALVEDGRAYPPSRLERAFDHRALIIQGMQDEAVDWRHPLAFVEASACPTLELLLLKEGDHRLTDYKAYLFGTMRNWLQRLGEA